MPSPFPGMDPYFENPAQWQGFHAKFLVAIDTHLSHSLPKGYYCDVEQHVWLRAEDPEEWSPTRRPDVYVSKNGGGTAVLTKRKPSPSLEVSLPLTNKVKGPRYLTIYDKNQNRVVTVIELLSPTNKRPGEDRESYLEKRNDYLQSDTNLVELDLLRDGDRLPMGLPRPPLTDYYCVVSRADHFPKASVWSFGIRDPMPDIPIPLGSHTRDIILDLRSCLDRVYDDSNYASRFDYRLPPVVGLHPGDAEWAASLLKSHAKKSPRRTKKP